MIFTQENGLVFKINTDDYTAYIVKSRKAKGNVFIPSSIYHDTHKYIIKRISTNSFQNNCQIKSIEFSQNSELHTIENDAFNGSALESISLPSSIEELQEGWCRSTAKLRKVIISTNSKKFKYLDSDHKIIISNNNKKNEAKEEEFENIIFASRDISEAKIPSFIKCIKSYSFHECEQLKKIDFSEDSKLESIEKESFSYSSLENILIPSSVKHIGEKAFSWCQSLEKVEFSENSNLISIGNETFSKSSLKSITIPSHLKQIGDGAFSWCQYLKSIEFPDDSELRSFGNCAFYGSMIESISIPSKIDDLKVGWCRYTPLLINVFISLNNKCFLCYKEKMIIGKSEQKNDVFDVLFFVYRNVVSALVPKFIRQIGSYAFSGCQSLKKIEFENESDLNSIGKGSFSNSFIEEISIPKHVKIIGEEAFSRCYKLKKIEFIEDSELHTIEKFAFEDSSIESISIPANVEDLQEGWCKGTSKLKNVIISSFNKHFKYLDSNQKIIIGKSTSKEKEEFENIIFANRDIKDAKIPSFIKHIKSFSFYQCDRLKTINFSDDSTLETIGKESFSYSSISHIKIPSNLRIISESSFLSCYNLNKVEFCKNSELQRIEKNAFSYSSLERIKIPIGIKNIEEGSFSFCKNLKTVEFEKGTKLRQINKKSFSYSSIESILVPLNVNKIGEAAFFSCTELICIEFLNDHLLIEGFCFKDCTNLLIASFPNARRVAYIGEVFSDVPGNFSLFINPHALIISTIE